MYGLLIAQKSQKNSGNNTEILVTTVENLNKFPKLVPNFRNFEKLVQNLEYFEKLANVLLSKNVVNSQNHCMTKKRHRIFNT